MGPEASILTDIYISFHCEFQLSIPRVSAGFDLLLDLGQCLNLVDIISTCHGCVGPGRSITPLTPLDRHQSPYSCTYTLYKEPGGRVNLSLTKLYICGAAIYQIVQSFNTQRFLLHTFFY